MADLSFFNPQEYNPAGFGGLIGAGTYIGHITDSELVENSNKDGYFLLLKYSVVNGDPEHETDWNGAVIMVRLNVINNSEKAERFARNSLASIFLACGYTEQQEDSESLHGIDHIIRVVVVPPTKGKDGTQYGAKNEIKGWKVYDESAVLKCQPVPDFSNTEVEEKSTGKAPPKPAQQAQQTPAKPAPVPGKRPVAATSTRPATAPASASAPTTAGPVRRPPGTVSAPGQQKPGGLPWAQRKPATANQEVTLPPPDFEAEEGSPFEE